MNAVLKNVVLHEINLGKDFYVKGELRKAFHYFERVHVLGQLSPRFHTLSHIWMLKIALKEKNVREILGQLFRIPTGLIGSAIGIVPTGNTGGADVNPFKSMPIPEDLKNILEKEI